jgi:hypothetical protein
MKDPFSLHGYLNFNRDAQFCIVVHASVEKIQFIAINVRI